MPQTLTSDSIDLYKKVLVVGDSGSGKTRFLGTFPKPIFIADFDGGLESLVGTPDVVYERYEGEAGYKAFRAELDKWLKPKGGPQYGCQTFAVDSLSMMSDSILRWVVGKSARAEGRIDQDMWGEAIRKVKDVLSDLKVRLPCHSVMTAHLQVEKDELLGGITWLPSVYGRELPGKVAAYFGEVYLTSPVITTENGNSKVNYRLQVVPDQRVKFVKSNMNKKNYFSQYEDPDFEKLLAKVQAKENVK